MRFRAAGATHQGTVRENNEDAFLIDPELGIFLVADGMGGHEHGELASRLAVQTVAAHFRSLSPDPAATLEVVPPGGPAALISRRLEAAVAEANRLVHSRGLDLGLDRTMGTTLAGLAASPFGLVLVNVGDSRIYRIRGREIRQISPDHSLVMEEVRRGILTPEEARASPRRNIIYRALGMAPSVEPDVYLAEPVPGDLYLLCSDGVTDVLGEGRLLSLALDAGGENLDIRCQGLLQAALEAQPRDNLTVVLVRVEDGAGGDPAGFRAGGSASQG